MSEVEHEEELQHKVREHVLAAAQILKGLGPDKARVGWMLEDTLMYLEELEAQEQPAPVSSNESISRLESLSKIATG